MRPLALFTHPDCLFQQHDARGLPASMSAFHITLPGQQGVLLAGVPDRGCSPAGSSCSCAGMSKSCVLPGAVGGVAGVAAVGVSEPSSLAPHSSGSSAGRQPPRRSTCPRFRFRVSVGV